MADKLNQLEKQFYSDGFRLGMKATESPVNTNRLFLSVREMYSAIDEFIDYFLQFAKNNNKTADCKRGCSWCCYQPVFALNYEIEILNQFIQQNFNEKARSEILKRSASKQNKVKDLKGEELLNSKFPCPLLKDGYCLAYEARPMACRIYLSTNLETCLDFYKNPADEKSFPELMQFPMRTGRLMNEGFKSALKSKGVVFSEFRIEDGILQKPTTF